MTTIIFVLTVLSLIPVSGFAVLYDPTPKKSKFGIKGGLILPTSIRISENGFRRDLETDIGVSGGIYLDIPINTRMFYGVAMDLYDIRVKNLVERRKFFDFSLTLKRRFLLTDKTTELRPGIAVGIGHLARIGFVKKATTYLTLKGTFEASFQQSRRFAWLLEFSVLGVPMGGNSRFDINGGPTLLARAGITF